MNKMVDPEAVPKLTRRHVEHAIERFQHTVANGVFQETDSPDLRPPDFILGIAKEQAMEFLTSPDHSQKRIVALGCLAATAILLFASMKAAEEFRDEMG